MHFANCFGLYCLAVMYLYPAKYDAVLLLQTWSNGPRLGPQLCIAAKTSSRGLAVSLPDAKVS